MYHGSDCYRIHTATWSMAISLKRVACFQPLPCFHVEFLLNCIRSTWKFQTTSWKVCFCWAYFKTQAQTVWLCVVSFSVANLSLFVAVPKKQRNPRSRCWTYFWDIPLLPTHSVERPSAAIDEIWWTIVSFIAFSVPPSCKLNQSLRS